MLIQRTLPVGLPVNLTNPLLLDPGEKMDYRFIRAFITITDSGDNGVSPCLQLRDSANAIIGEWWGFDPASGTEGIPPATAGRIQIDSGPEKLCLGTPVNASGEILLHLPVPSDLIVLGSQGQSLFLILDNASTGGSGTTSAGIAFFTIAFQSDGA